MSRKSKPTKLSKLTRHRERSARPCSERTQGKSTVTCEMNLQRGDGGGVGRTAHGRGRSPSPRSGRREREINLGKSVLRLPGPARGGRCRRRENAPLRCNRGGCGLAAPRAAVHCLRAKVTVTPSPPEVRSCKIILLRFPSCRTWIIPSLIK